MDGELSPTGAVAGLGARLLTGSYYGQTIQIWSALIMAATLAAVLVGLIGMTGIIINDSIVLVTTHDEYAGTRPPRRAIIDAACDRLRPVLLTTPVGRCLMVSEWKAFSA